MNSIIDIWES